MDAVLRLAPIALSLAGFSGLVAALRSRAIKDWLPRERLLLSLLLAGTLGVMFFSLLPSVFDSFGASTWITWSVSSVTLGLYLMTVVILGLRSERALVRRGHKRAQPFEWWLFPATLIVSVGLLVNASGIVFAPSIGPYYTALLFILMEAAGMFLLLLSFPTEGTGA